MVGAAPFVPPADKSEIILGIIVWNPLQSQNDSFHLGVWGPYIGAMAGVTVPLVAMRHAYVVTERIEGIQNMPNMRDHDASVYLKLQGDALCVGGYEPSPIFIDQVCCKFVEPYKVFLKLISYYP